MENRRPESGWEQNETGMGIDAVCERQWWLKRVSANAE